VAPVILAVMTAGRPGTRYWPEPGASSEAGPSTAARTWRAPWLSFEDAQYVFGNLIGLVFLAVGVDNVLFPTANIPRGTALWITFLGALCTAMCTACWRLPARRVQLSADGTLSFESSWRRLEVKPGELKSVRQFPLDGRRFMPLLVRADNGWVLLARSLNDLEDLRNTLCAYSPGASIAQFVPRAMRSDTRTPPRFLYRVMRTPRGGPPRP
jgi:hypothetical protein